MSRLLPSSAEALLRWYEGLWTIEREIAGEGATFTGTAVFEPTDTGGLSYRESGILTLHNGQSLQTNRRYLHRATADGIAVEFADGPNKGELFVLLTFAEIAPGALEARAVHHCGKDRYAVRYTLRPPDRFETDIEVAGPRKAYRAFSLYTRAP